MPYLRDYIYQLTALEVAYEGDAGDAIGMTQALLYISWLAGRLGWRPAAARVRPTEREIWFEAPHGDVSVRILGGEQPAGGGGGLLAVTFAAGPEDQPTNLLLRCADDASYIESNVEIPFVGERRRITRYSRPTVAEVLLDELDSRHTDEVYLEAMAVVGALPERLGR
jgi:hypothetical protein